VNYLDVGVVIVGMGRLSGIGRGRLTVALGVVLVMSRRPHGATTGINLRLDFTGASADVDLAAAKQASGTVSRGRWRRRTCSARPATPASPRV
jgi:hypothetical protein